MGIKACEIACDGPLFKIRQFCNVEAWPLIDIMGLNVPFSASNLEPSITSPMLKDASKWTSMLIFTKHATTK